MDDNNKDNKTSTHADDELDGARGHAALKHSAWRKLVQDTRDFWGCGTSDGAEEHQIPIEEHEGSRNGDQRGGQRRNHAGNYSESGGGGGRVLRLKRAPTALEFARIVRRNQPVVFEGLCADWNATRCWSREYLEQMLGNKARVNVAVTPNGLGDAVTQVDEADLCFAPQNVGTAGEVKNTSQRSVRSGDEGHLENVPQLAAGKYFVQPEERQMTMAEFFRMLLLPEVTTAEECNEAGTACCSESGTQQAPTPAEVNISGSPSNDLVAKERSQWSAKSQIAYLSYQNDSFREQFAPLQQDVPPSIDFAAAAFGNEPDAVNLWIGDERAVTTTHVDHYENMYAVVEGEKHFHLLPPPSGLGLYEREFPAGRFRFDATSARWKVEVEFEEDEQDFTETECTTQEAMGQDDFAAGQDVHRLPQTRCRRLRRVPWIELDPAAPDLKRFPRFRTHCVQPLHCVVRKGDVLYLPALWYHRVAQRGLTIAVNYWHDMEFMSPNFVYTSFIREIIARDPPDNSL